MEVVQPQCTRDARRRLRAWPAVALEERCRVLRQQAHQVFATCLTPLPALLLCLVPVFGIQPPSPRVALPYATSDAAPQGLCSGRGWSATRGR